MITENLSTLKIHKLTQEQYDRELAAGNIDENAIYLTPDDDIGVEIDTELDENSTNPVMNKAITEMFNAVSEVLNGLDEKYERVAYKSTEIYDDTSDYDSYPTTKAVYDYVEAVKAEIQSKLDEITNSSSGGSIAIDENGIVTIETSSGTTIDDNGIVTL